MNFPLPDSLGLGPEINLLHLVICGGEEKNPGRVFNSSVFPPLVEKCRYGLGLAFGEVNSVVLLERGEGLADFSPLEVFHRLSHPLLALAPDISESGFS